MWRGWFVPMHAHSILRADNLARQADPWHIFAGAIEVTTASWWFSDTSSTLPGFLSPTPGVLSEPVLQLGSQPTVQLSIDLPLMENYPHPWTCLEDGCVDAFAMGDSLWTQSLRLGQPVANSAGGIGATTLYPSPAAFRSVLWLGLIQAGMSHQLAFIFGPYGEAGGAHERYTSQVGAFRQELSPLLPAIHRSVASSEPAHPSTTVVTLADTPLIDLSSSMAFADADVHSRRGGSPQVLGWSSRAWRRGSVDHSHPLGGNLTIHAVPTS